MRHDLRKFCNLQHGLLAKSDIPCAKTHQNPKTHPPRHTLNRKYALGPRLRKFMKAPPETLNLNQSRPTPNWACVSHSRLGLKGLDRVYRGFSVLGLGLRVEGSARRVQAFHRRASACRSRLHDLMEERPTAGAALYKWYSVKVPHDTYAVRVLCLNPTVINKAPILVDAPVILSCKMPNP